MKARCFPGQRNVIGEIQQLAVIVLHLHKVQRCFRCKYLDLTHTRLYLLLFLFGRSCSVIVGSQYALNTS